MTYRLFLDDERYPPQDGKAWTVARSSDEAIHAVKMFGMPDFISFDHDLGGEDTSIVFIKWLIDEVIDSDPADGLAKSFPRAYYIHSQNPVGVKNIRSLMSSFIQHLNEGDEA